MFWEFRYPRILVEKKREQRRIKNLDKQMEFVVFQRANSIYLFLKKPLYLYEKSGKNSEKVHSTFLHNSFSREHNYVLIRLLFNERQTQQKAMKLWRKNGGNLCIAF